MPVYHYKEGDKVVYINEAKHQVSHEFYPPVGTIGTVIKRSLDGTYLVQWPKGTTLAPYEWWCNHTDINPAYAKKHGYNKILIQIDKKDPRKVVAKDLGTGEIGVAKCNQEDEFDFHVGASIAFARLLGKEPPDDKPKPKFKAGDIIIGNEKATKMYTITKQGWVGIVTEVHFGEGFNLIIAKHVNGTEQIGPFFTLDPDCFDLA